MTLRQWLEQAGHALQGTEAPRRAAELLLCSVLNITRVALMTHPERELPPDAGERLAGLLKRRLAGEPVAYLLGRREFYGRSFDVDPSTLIPRPESECLVDEALARLPERAVHFADLGTGSGCLAVTLAAERPLWRGVAVDISEHALHMARRNAERLGAADRLTFVLADFTLPAFLPDFPPDSPDANHAGLDLVISNPPYVSEAEYAALDPGVRDYEPKTALLSGPAGLEHARAVVELAWRILRPGGLVLMEHGAAQGEAARALCAPRRWREVRTLRDLAGLDRCLAAIHR
ncbi:MAG: peptide chain release factor N(5)-glutamine methyltransferase [Desulfovibrionaceae bacterium]|nr:peptide chain release factor N(5)-glutamine methyltransferase [Desulfovibrionaceae bacterium]